MQSCEGGRILGGPLTPALGGCGRRRGVITLLWGRRSGVAGVGLCLGATDRRLRLYASSQALALGFALAFLRARRPSADTEEGVCYK